MIDSYKDIRKGDLVEYKVNLCGKIITGKNFVDGFGTYDGQVIIWVKKEDGGILATRYEDIKKCTNVSQQL